MPQRSQPSSPSSPTTSLTSPSRWKDRLRLRFRRREYEHLNRGSTPSTSSASGLSAIDSGRPTFDSSSQLEDDNWVDEDSPNTSELPRSIGSSPGKAHPQGQGAGAQMGADGENRRGEGTEARDDESSSSQANSPHSAYIPAHLQALLNARSIRCDHFQEPDASPLQRRPTCPPIPERKPHLCRVCGESFYAGIQTKDLCYVCASQFAF